ncbi:hypothetical protein [uncultured Microbulbifer sp.]|uniref:hypothetical protein n=1 Tax=uncultured Microbulbifer sp. TaxID=348147 RepID=UPI00261A107D|nr:hypothetical protein [uncultured Microbulbifer sp.]
MNSTDTLTSRPRGSAQQWQALIDEWQSSAMFVQFFIDRAIGYVSFCQWRKRMSVPDKNIV